MTPPVEDPGRALASSEQPPAGDTFQVAVWPRKSVAREYLEAVLIALVLALVIRTFFIQAYLIPSGSMEPTLLIGDHILVSKMAYGLRLPDSIFGLHMMGLPLGRYLVHFGDIHRGDVIVFVHPQERDKDLIKRVIGLPGDKVRSKMAVYGLTAALSTIHMRISRSRMGSASKFRATTLASWTPAEPSLVRSKSPWGDYL